MSEQGRGRRGAMVLDDQQATKLQDKVKKERAKQLKTEVSPLIKTFQKSESMDERAAAAKRLMEIGNDPDADPKTKTMVNEYSQSLRLQEYLDLYKASQDITEVGMTAQASLGSGAFVAKRSLQELMQDPDLDPMARKLAAQFGTFLPEYQKQEALEKWNKLPDPKPLDQPKPPDPTLPEGYTFSQSGKKTVIMNPQNKLFMKPGDGDDPRLTKMMVDSMAGVMEPEVPQKLVDKDPNNAPRNKFGKPKLTDKKMGMGIVQQMSSSGSLMNEVGSYMIDKARNFDPRRTKKIVELGDQQLGHTYSQDLGL